MHPKWRLPGEERRIRGWQDTDISQMPYPETYWDLMVFRPGHDAQPRPLLATQFGEELDLTSLSGPGS